ncbi:conserved hypothetical proetin [Bacillus cytotoxicus NVH 391-98]|nr:conserved hypothetical proetin [Bacillus cytotoxicus NVH 391-98]
MIIYNSFSKGGIHSPMTFHIFFFTITLQKRTLSEEEILRKQQLKQTMEEIIDRKSLYYTQMY